MSDLPKDHPRFKAFHDRFPLSEAQYEGLKADIVQNKQVRNRLVVWQGFLVDGYNRKAIIIEEKINNWSSITLDPNWTEDQVYDWLVDNQLNRRNLTEQQQELLIGEKYNREKQREGRPEKKLGNHCPVSDKGNTSEKIGKELGKSPRTVKTYGKHEEIYQNLPPDVAQMIDNQPPGKKLSDCQWKALDECDNIGQVARNIRVHHMSLEDAYEDATGKKMKGAKSAKPKPPPKPPEAPKSKQPDILKRRDGWRASIVKLRESMQEAINGECGELTQAKSNALREVSGWLDEAYKTLGRIR